jgi:hypothetical protein
MVYGSGFSPGLGHVLKSRVRERVLNNVVQTGHHTTKPNPIGSQKTKQKNMTQTTKHNPDREKLRPGAFSPCYAQHAWTRPTARRDRHRLHKR